MRLTALVACALACATPARAEVTGVTIESRAVVADGQPFGSSGAYEKLTGTIRFALDPSDLRNPPIADLDGWLRAAGAWTSVVDLSNTLLSASADQAILLNPATSRCLLNIDVGMLVNDSGRHTVVLRSPVTTTVDGHVVMLKVWSWAGIRDVTIARSKFESTYFGANVAFT